MASALLHTSDRFAHFWLIEELEHSSYASSTDQPYETKAIDVRAIGSGSTLEAAKHDDPREGHAGDDIYRHSIAHVSQQNLIWPTYHHVRVGKVAGKIDYLAKYECTTKNVCDEKCVHYEIEPIQQRKIAALIIRECGFN